jgi:hypothetical protein
VIYEINALPYLFKEGCSILRRPYDHYACVEERFILYVNMVLHHPEEVGVIGCTHYINLRVYDHGISIYPHDQLILAEKLTNEKHFIPGSWTVECQWLLAQY